MNKKTKLFSGVLTIFVIALLVMMGPASAINVKVIANDVDVSTEDTQTLTVEAKFKDGEFLPFLYADLEFSDGINGITCRLNQDDTISGCSFLALDSIRFEGLMPGYGPGYGYGYGAYGYGDNTFGYGYGYGYHGSGEGKAIVTFIIDSTQLPGAFMDEEIGVEAKVYGGTEDNSAYFKGDTSFDVSASPVEVSIDPTQIQTVTYNSITIEVPAGVLPLDTTQLIVEQVKATDEPSNADIKLMGKTFDLNIDSSTKTFSGYVTVTIFYTDDELALAGLTDETKIVPFWYDSNIGDWVEITSGIVRDTANNEISFTTTHFSQFSLLADNRAATAVTGGATTGGAGADTLMGGAARGATPTPTPIPTPAEITPITPAAPITPTEEATPAVTPAAPAPGFLGITGAAVADFVKENPLSTGGVVVLALILVGIVVSNYLASRRRRNKSIF